MAGADRCGTYCQHWITFELFDASPANSPLFQQGAPATRAGIPIARAAYACRRHRARIREGAFNAGSIVHKTKLQTCCSVALLRPTSICIHPIICHLHPIGDLQLCEAALGSCTGA